ncbi:uncharacterized protein LOC127879910 isoform X1 [Dreissena polymorpha]|nr:uncharacterized protein LOC127879910 isoform X1 [Dreissena polymorpha]
MLKPSGVYHCGKYILFLLIFARFADGSYQLSVPSEYVAFSGHLIIGYKIPDAIHLPNAFVRLYLISDNREEVIQTLAIDPAYKTGNLQITCGIIEVAGQYDLKMFDYDGGRMLIRAVVIVRWPEVTLTLPSGIHYAQSSPVLLRINSSAVCNPLLKKYSFKIELDYSANDSMISKNGKKDVIYSEPFSDFFARNFSLQLPCHLFDTSGIFGVTLTSTFSAISQVARSNPLVTSLNPAYKIIIYQKTIFPCADNFIINYGVPQCPGLKENNRIRIYQLIRTSFGSMASPVTRNYVMERFADPDQTFLSENCSAFETVSVGFCFQYVTFVRDNVVINQTERCLSAHPDSVLPIDGGWSRWSPWSQCSKTCGAGEQTRYRMCDSPTPNFGGAFCSGEGIQRQACSIFCPDSIPYTPLHSPNVDVKCACGCKINDTRGDIIASGRCARTSKWLISAEPGYTIALQFTYINLYQPKQWLKVRNGFSSDSDLLAFTDGRVVVQRVTSTGNQMLVEFFSEPTPLDNGDVRVYSKQATDPIHVHGFIASFISNYTEFQPAPISMAPLASLDSPSIWESTVTIVGISLCGVVVIIAIAFVIYHRVCHLRDHKYAMAAHDESPKRMCKSTSMRSTPSHESHHGIEIEHDMEIPLTGIPNADKRKAKTPGANSQRSKGSITSAHSHNLKVHRANIEVERNNVHLSSPLTPRGDYTPVPQDSSPRRVIRNPDIEQVNGNNVGMFRTSPIVRPKVPRSPKVHPSPKIKKHHSSKTPTNDKRFDGSGRDSVHRVVMGSDHTPTNSVTSPQLESVKHECETPTNINNAPLYRKHSKLKSEALETPDSENVGAKPNDIKLKDLSHISTADDRKPASGTSDDSISPEKHADSKATTSFIEHGGKPRRPTSLTESYSKMSLSSVGKASDECNKEKSSVTSRDDRQNALPKPDGQSPKSQRVETLKSESQNSSPVKTSKTSTPLSVRSSHSDRTDAGIKTKSPARSINTPSDVIELEYDDFIDMDDTYSYFDPVETEKLTWHGVERVKSTKNS